MDEVRNLELDTHWPYVAVDTLDVACHCFKGGRVRLSIHSAVGKDF